MNSSLKAFLIICGCSAILFLAFSPFVVPRPKVVVKYKPQELNCLVADMPVDTEGYIAWNDVYGELKPTEWYESSREYVNMYINPGAMVTSKKLYSRSYKVRRSRSGYYLYSETSTRYVETTPKFQVSKSSRLIEPLATSLKDGN